jgi:hypothetical protein
MDKQHILDEIRRTTAIRPSPPTRVRPLGHSKTWRCCAQQFPLHQSESRRDEVEVEDFGFVYLLRSGRFFKIGRTNALGRRERELVLQLPEKANVVHHIRTDDPVGIEAYWHKRFEARRWNGEWFELDSADLKAFRRRKFM